MSLESKQSRLKELSNPNNFLSDEEHEEKEKLEEELNMIHQEETREVIPSSPSVGQTTETTELKKQKKSLLDIVLNKLKKKPATWDEIQQLRLERLKAIYKRDIAVANYHRKNPGGKPRQSKSISKNRDIEKEFSSSAKDFRTMSGTNNKNKYKGLIP